MDKITPAPQFGVSLAELAETTFDACYPSLQAWDMRLAIRPVLYAVRTTVVIGNALGNNDPDLAYGYVWHGAILN